MTRAAELLHVSQPTLSKTLKALEEELGKKLFTRHSFSIALTDEGMLLRDRAEDLIAMADKIEQEFVSLVTLPAVTCTSVSQSHIRYDIWPGSSEGLNQYILL